jgi:hypothetical protein
VRDWRHFPYRVNYIANLFVISRSKAYRAIFQRPVLDVADMRQFLSGELPARLGVKLSPAQARQWRKHAEVMEHGKEPVA